MVFPMNAPLFDLLVLSVVNAEDAYGYQISQIIKTASNTKDSTLYPILKRLQEKQYLNTYDQQYQGRNRKYYTITDDGKTYLNTLLTEWDEYKDAVDNIIKGGITSEQE